MLNELKNNPIIKSVIVLLLGFIMLDFFFALLFGSGNMVQSYAGLVGGLINLLVLVIVGAFFYGIFKLFQENAALIKPHLQVSQFFCQKCGKIKSNGWTYCAYCGSDVKGEGFKG